VEPSGLAVLKHLTNNGPAILYRKDVDLSNLVAVRIAISFSL